MARLPTDSEEFLHEFTRCDPISVPASMRLLFLTYYFPPAGGIAVQRALKWATYLPEFGWEPTVLTVEDGAFPHVDESLTEQIPDGLDVERTPWFNPFQWYKSAGGEGVPGVGFAGSSNRSLVSKAARWIRGNVFIPDARAGWVRHAVNRAAQLHREQPFDAVLTTGPPHSTHVAGLRIQKRLNLPWIADFRDPWTEVYYYDDFPRSAVARYIDANLEARVLRMADRIVSVGPRLADRLEELAGLTEPPAVIYNGYDEADFQRAGFQEEDFRGLGVRSTDHPVFTIGHVGTFSHSMNPPALWEALAKLRAQGERVALKFTGTLDQSVLDSLSAYGLRDNVDLIPPVSHAEALRAMCTADVLLLSIPTSAPDQESILTGKLFEYLRAGRPILAFGPAEGDASAVLKHTERGSTFAHEGSSDGVLEWIHHQKTAFPSAALPVTPAVRAFERRSQAGQLAALLTEAVSHSSESTPA